MSISRTILRNRSAVTAAAVLVFVALAVYAACGLAAKEKLEVDILDVGQGDSILIKTPAGSNILIDGGPDRLAVKRLARELAWWDRRIDLLVLTHAHDDHLAGALEVLDRYRVAKILYSGAQENTANYSAWLDKIKARSIPVFLAEHPLSIDLGRSARLEVLYPRASLAGSAPADANGSSIVCRLVYGENRILLMGDAESGVERELLKGGADLTAQAVKLSHHGSDNATGDELLEKIRPDYALISVGAGNNFGHPSLRVLKRLARRGVKVLRTDRQGTLRLTADGRTLKVATGNFWLDLF